MDKPKYLYHGSSHRVDVLMPHQARDWKHEEGCEHGVYATSDRDVALAFALGAVPDETGGYGRTTRREDGDSLKMVFWRGHPNFGGKGYLYTMSSEGFEHAGGDQWVCREPVTPVEILEINVDDYLHLFRYATEEEKREIQREFEETIKAKKERNRQTK